MNFFFFFFLLTNLHENETKQQQNNNNKHSKSWNGPMGHSHDLSPFSGNEIDVSHTVNKLSFGPPYPGQRSPLDGAHYSSEASSAPGPAPSGAGAAAAMLAAMNGASPDDGKGYFVFEFSSSFCFF